MNKLDDLQGREDLIEVMQFLSDLDLQKQTWSIKNSVPIGTMDFDMAMHFLLDDTDLSHKPLVEIGSMLINEEEALAVQNVAKLILSIFDKVGNDHIPDVYFNDQRWSEVVQAAGKAQGNRIKFE